MFTKKTHCKNIPKIISAEKGGLSVLDVYIVMLMMPFYSSPDYQNKVLRRNKNKYSQIPAFGSS